MYVTEAIRIYFLIYFVLLVAFFLWFIRVVKKPAVKDFKENETGIDWREKRFFLTVVAILVIGHIVTLSNIVPWQKWQLWEKQVPVKTFAIEVSDYQFDFPENPMIVEKGEFVEFDLTTTDVTYGFGVFREDGTMVFQLSVLPGYNNRYTWNFSEPGTYDIRSTEYSGDQHSSMYEPGALVVK